MNVSLHTISTKSLIKALDHSRRVSFDLSPSVHDAFTREARREGYTPAGFAVALIEAYLNHSFLARPGHRPMQILQRERSGHVYEPGTAEVRELLGTGW